MFLIKCEDDGSYCIVDNHDVVCDETVIEDGVPFFWHKKKFTGEIIMRSENVELLNKEMRKLKKIIDTSKKKSVKLNNNINETDSGKRKIVINRAWSPEQPSTSTKKIKLQSNIITNKKEIFKKNGKPKTVKYDSSNTDSSDTSQYNEDNKENDLNTLFSDKDIKNNTERSEIFHSPTKEELKEIALKYYKLLDKQSVTKNISFIDTTDRQPINKDLRNVKENEQNKRNDSMIELYDYDTNLDNDQLLGCEYTGDEMIHLRNGIFCRKKIYNYAIGSSHRASHIARKLLEGVFKEEALVKCTFTGQSPRSLGKERQREKMSCLHDLAKSVIIDFSMEMAVKKDWEYQSREKIKQAMSQRLGELKRDKRHIEQKEVV